VRSVALTAGTDEFSLTQIADNRPLFVEPERGWGQHEYAHVSIDGTWLRFEAEPLGPSDRKVDVQRTLKRLSRLFAALEEMPGDEESARVTQLVVTGHAKALLKSGDTKNAYVYLDAVDKPGTNVAVSGSIDISFAATLSHMPANRVEREREKERAKIREAERKSPKKGARPRPTAAPR
jgi:hypothetical protein